LATPVKIGVIGAGSATFSVDLVRDVCLREGLAGSRIVLMDVDADRVDLMHRFATRYAAEVGADLSFGATSDREEAMAEADFVVNAVQVGGHALVERLRAFAEEHGYYRGIGLHDWLQVRMTLSVARDMERLCPNAWLLQVASPLPEACTAVSRRTRTKVCGLSRGHSGYGEIARVLGLDPSLVRARSAGINRCAFLTHFEHEGHDAYPLIDKWIRDEAEDRWRDHQPRHDENQMSRAAAEQYRTLGLMPVGDTARDGGWWFHTDLRTKKRWYGELGGLDSEFGWGRHLAGLDKRLLRIVAATNDPDARLTELYAPRPSDEQHVPLIDALVNDERAELQVNVPNRGAIEGVPDDVVVEVSALCSRRGVEPVHVGRLPELVVLSALAPRILRLERTISLALEPDRRMLLALVLNDHRTRSWDDALAFTRRAMALPEFAEMAREMKQREMADDERKTERAKEARA